MWGNEKCLCNHKFEWSDIHNEFVCVKCLHVMTIAEKHNELIYANKLRQIMEQKGDSVWNRWNREKS